MIPAERQSGNRKCADGVVIDGILDASSEDAKADWRRGRDDEDRIKAVLETPGPPPTTRDPQRNPVVEESAANLAESEGSPLRKADWIFQGQWWYQK